MWVKKAPSLDSDAAVRPSSTKKSPSIDYEREGNNSYESVEGKRRRKEVGCFTFKEVSIEPETASSLKDVDSTKLKDEIRRWAKAVVAYARQVSGRLGVLNSSSGSSRHNGRGSLGDVSGG
ncbi:hypothetical protein MLD38_028928 [Melastoma candidum]|uniref:Uncharacterized protein n=1 Tax=Melastoma candidum TaxID=119954 RepID=A0ACB9N4A2_9MYRT|nr:hypothetical protein MLD38_028928 [Melastoma candidum]